MRVAAAAIAALAAASAAAQDSWDYLPAAAYEGEPITLILRVGGGAAAWRARDDHGAALPLVAGAESVTLRALPDGRSRLVLVDPAGGEHAVRLTRPGEGKGLAADEHGRLAFDAAPAVLTLPRVEPDHDRRWGFLRHALGDAPAPCARRVRPARIAWGEPALPAEIAAAQAIDPAGEDVLVELPGGDRVAGWKHREYRQALAWLVADLAARSARRVVLVQPPAPEAEAGQAEPLREEAGDVAAAYHCPLVETGTLAALEDWSVGGEVIGTELNQRGRDALERLLAPWLPAR